MLDHLKSKAVTQTAFLLGVHKKCRFTGGFAAAVLEVQAHAAPFIIHFTSFVRQYCRFEPFVVSRRCPYGSAKGAYQMKKIGMIGGLSWVSTAEYYKRTNEIMQQVLCPLKTGPFEAGVFG